MSEPAPRSLREAARAAHHQRELERFGVELRRLLGNHTPPVLEIDEQRIEAWVGEVKFYWSTHVGRVRAVLGDRVSEPLCHLGDLWPFLEGR